MAFIIGSAAKTHFSFETTGKEAGEGEGGRRREKMLTLQRIRRAPSPGQQFILQSCEISRGFHGKSLER